MRDHKHTQQITQVVDVKVEYQDDQRSDASSRPIRDTESL